MIARLEKEGCKSESTPLELGCRLDTSQQLVTDGERDEMIEVPYRSAIRSFVSLATCTTPDLAAAVSELVRFTQNPRAAHWKGLKRVLRYLSGTMGEGPL